MRAICTSAKPRVCERMRKRTYHAGGHGGAVLGVVGLDQEVAIAKPLENVAANTEPPQVGGPSSVGAARGLRRAAWQGRADAVRVNPGVGGKARDGQHRVDARAAAADRGAALLIVGDEDVEVVGVNVAEDEARAVIVKVLLRDVEVKVGKLAPVRGEEVVALPHHPAVRAAGVVRAVIHSLPQLAVGFNPVAPRVSREAEVLRLPAGEAAVRPVVRERHRVGARGRAGAAAVRAFLVAVQQPVRA